MASTDLLETTEIRDLNRGRVFWKHQLGNRLRYLDIDGSYDGPIDVSGVDKPMTLGAAGASGATGSGILLSASVTAAMGVYADDGGAAIASDKFVRAGRFRFMKGCTAQSEAEMGGVIGQFVSKATTNYHNCAGAWGSYEVITSGTVAGHPSGPATDVWCQAGIIGRVGGASITIASGAVLAGIAAMSNIASGQLTNSGVYAGLYVGKWSGATAWGYGLYVQAGHVTTAGVYIGAGATHALDAQGKGRFGTGDWGEGATGVLLNGTDPDMVLQAHGRINATVASAPYAASYNTISITATQSNDVSAFGSWNECYITGGTIDLDGSGHYAGCWGHLEVAGTVATSTGHMAGLIGTLMTPATFTNNGILAGCYVDTKITSGIVNNGTTAHFACVAVPGEGINPGFAMFIDGADSFVKFNSGSAYEDGVKITASVFGDTSHDLNADAILRCYVGDTPYYIPMVGADKVTNES